MLRSALILFVMVLVFGAGVIITSPRTVDGPEYALLSTVATIKAANLAASSYAKERLRIPTDAEGLQLLIEKSARSNESPSLDQMPKDFWGHPLIYKVLDAKTLKFTIYSSGPDGIDNGGAGDDVIAGKKNYQCELYGSCLSAKDYMYQAFVIATLLTLLASIGVAIYSIKNAGKTRPPVS